MPVGSNQYLLLVGSVNRITVTERIKAPFWYQGPLGSNIFLGESQAPGIHSCGSQIDAGLNDPRWLT